MKNINSYFNLGPWIIFLVLSAICISTSAQENESNQDTIVNPSEEILNLVQNANPKTTLPQPSGTILLPDSLTNSSNVEKKCMTVCAAWGEDCTYINRGAGGMTRSCRRTCQQFTEECF
jgi:hypothetical protein